jgi:hypothetical protein
VKDVQISNYNSDQPSRPADEPPHVAGQSALHARIVARFFGGLVRQDGFDPAWRCCANGSVKGKEAQNHAR